MQVQKRVGRCGVKRVFAGWVGGDQTSEKIVAQVFQQEEALAKVFRKDRWSRETKTPQMPGHGGKGCGVVGPAGWVVHQDGRRRAKAQAFVAAVRRIPC